MSFISCVYCHKECKNSDSRPYPNSKSKERIHNRCQLKKNLADKSSAAQPQSSTLDISTSANLKKGEGPDKLSLSDRITQKEVSIEKLLHAKKLSKLVEERSKASTEKVKSTSQLFFDLKAGIAKPNEKRSYLHHRNLCEIASRYDDNGFQEEAIGRAYDHSGKDLNTLGDSESEEESCGTSNEVDKSLLPEAKSSSKKRKGTSKDERKTQRLKVDDKNPCWFCLSSPQVEKHLILAIGDFCYLTLAKGGLLDEHFLLLPIEHVSSLNDSDGNSKDLLVELDQFKKSLVDYFGGQSQGVVFFERNFRSVHWQLQVVPIPLDILETVETNIKLVSKKHFKNTNYLNISRGCSLSDVIPPDAPYMHWQLEPLGSQFVTQIQVKGSYFPIQFGRMVLADASILNCPDKVDWNKCAKSKEEYMVLVEKIKNKYKNFDIT